MSCSEWQLHPRLQADTAPVGELALCRVVAINDAVYRWLILVPRRLDAVEIADLAETDAALLTSEIVKVSRVLKQITQCDKLNVAAIGNVVPQLHVHVVARRSGDPLWPKPIWGIAEPRPGDAEAFAAFIAAIKNALDI